jgi:glutathione reductase (NADPH)
MAEFDTDLFVIGGGSGGVRAARIAAGHGARVMIAEEYRMGGTCVIRGCVPKKLLVYASHIHQEIEDAAGYGWTIPSATFDWPTLIANKDKEITRLEAAYTANVEKAGAQVVKARAVFEDAHTLRLADPGKAHPHRDGWSAEPWARDPRYRTRHFIERGVSSARVAEAYSDSRRRLYRA